MPHTQFGGYLSVVGGGGGIYNSFVNNYNALENDGSPVDLDLDVNVVGDQISVTANVELTGNITSSNNKVVYILTRHQDAEYYCTVTHYADGNFPLNTIGQTGSYTHNFPINYEWDLDDLTAVVLIQSFNNDHIHQGGTADIQLDNMLLLDLSYDGVSNDNDLDGVANPGETLELNFTLANNSMHLPASNLTAEFSTEAPIAIDNSNINFAEVMDIGENGNGTIQLTLPDDLSLGDYEFIMAVSADYTDLFENEFQYNQQFVFNLEVTLNQKDWPFTTGVQVDAAPAVVDINNDGEMEVIFGDYSGLLYVLDSHGNPLPGWPVDMGNQIWGSVAVADLEGDGDIEIVAASKNKRLLVFNTDGTEQVNYYANQYLMGTPALGNLDDDEDLEIVFGGYSSPGKIFVLNPDGSLVDGYPFQLGEKIQRGVALADFNGDGMDDIVCGTDSENLYLIYSDTSIADGFPFNASNDFRSAPAVLELADGQKLIFAGNRDDQFYCLNSDGSLRFSISTGADVESSPAFVTDPDLGSIIVFSSSDGFLYAVDINGNNLPNWPVDLGADASLAPLAGDFDGDDHPEIFIANDTGQIFLLEMDGTVMTPFPILGGAAIKGMGSIMDLDNDGDLEIFAGTSGSMFVVDVKTPGSTDDYWSNYRGSLFRNGYLKVTDCGNLVGDMNNDGAVDVLDIVGLVNIILSGETPDDCMMSQLNFDGNDILDILDLVQLVNLILNQG